MILKLRCPHCRGRVGSLIKELGQHYFGTQRICAVCGTIWRLHRGWFGVALGCAILVGVALIAACYLWLPRLLGYRATDWVALGVLLSWFMLLWPLVYGIVWRVKLKK